MDTNFENNDTTRGATTTTMIGPLYIVTQIANAITKMPQYYHVPSATRRRRTVTRWRPVSMRSPNTVGG